MPLDHRDMEVIDTVSQQLFNGFTLMTIAPSPGSRHGSGYSGETRDVSDEESPPQHTGSTHGQSSDLVLSTSPTRNSPNKRKRRDEGKSDDEGDDAHDRRGPKHPGPNSCDIFREPLACPFWKHDARRHRDCFKLRLNSIARVKQHLSRSHYSETHCERCRLVFASDSLRENHLRHEQCQWRCPDALVGISHQQRNDLSKKSKPHHSESERWFAIWAIGFPGQPAPSSPYMDPDLSQDMAEFRMYAQTHGARIVEEELGRHRLFVESQGSEWFQTLLRTALSRGQDMAFDAWLVARASPASSQAQGSHTPAQSLVSGGALGGLGGPSTTPDYMRINDIEGFGDGAANNLNGVIGDQIEQLPVSSTPGPIEGLGDLGQPRGNDINDLFGFDMGFDQDVDVGDFSFM
ncbi:uncharacterized protein PG986_005770 [Apiospora aurea]|uniref:C2H2-type domain-containing protein n=1 Tax=Apiospora aurea TaxID=335848 RepID=A0ABR1QIT7_9PEZI